MNPRMDPERQRVRDADAGAQPWRRWGPYLSERAWGTVREDYSANGDAWNDVSHDAARSRAFRWSEDGLAGICDVDQILCFAFAFWNGVDPILKERIFGLTNQQGNHGEDAKEYWWYLDSTPTHSWMQWRYHYPQGEFPYRQLIEENARRGRGDPEFELLDTAIFDEGRYWQITVDYAKAEPEDIHIRVTARNVGPDTASLHVLPTAWFRNRWAWGDPEPTLPVVTAADGRLRASDPHLGTLWLSSDSVAQPLVCDNDTNRLRLWGATPTTPYPKDGINDHVVRRLPTVNPGGQGTKGALHHVLTVEGGGVAVIHLRLSRDLELPQAERSDALMEQRRSEADAFYAPLTPDDATLDEARVLRQAAAGMLWSKQYYHYDVTRWLTGDRNSPPPPPGRGAIRNGSWRHLDCRDVIAMPDTWEYPWFAAWDLAFHCVPLAHLDPAFAKRQLILLCREWYMHPNGQLPAYEWSFSDVNPPVHAWAALRVFEIDGSRDIEFLERIFHKLIINFTWWVNREDAEGNNVFQGGFLGLDNIGPINRSQLPPGLGHLEQSDATAWMAMYALNLLEMALILARHDRTYEDLATKFFEHFAYIATAMDDQGLWNEADGYYYDVIHAPDGSRTPVRAHSAVGLIALCAVTLLDRDVADRLPDFTRRMDWFLANKPGITGSIAHVRREGVSSRRLLAVVSPERLVRILQRALDEAELLSPYGIRSLSRWHADHPVDLTVGNVTARLDYEPGESRTGLFGGNSNWRGPVWFPIGHLVIEALRRHHAFFGDDLQVEMPTGSGRTISLAAVTDDLARRMTSIFLRGSDGRRPVFGATRTLQQDPLWRDQLLFHEYFNADTGAGLGASHQTGWTGLVVDLIARRQRARDLAVCDGLDV